MLFVVSIACRHISLAVRSSVLAECWRKVTRYGNNRRLKRPLDLVLRPYSYLGNRDGPGLVTLEKADITPCRAPRRGDLSRVMEPGRNHCSTARPGVAISIPFFQTRPGPGPIRGSKTDKLGNMFNYFFYEEAEKSFRFYIHILKRL